LIGSMVNTNIHEPNRSPRTCRIATTLCALKEARDESIARANAVWWRCNHVEPCFIIDFYRFLYFWCVSFFCSIFSPAYIVVLHAKESSAENIESCVDKAFILLHWQLEINLWKTNSA
jgi:hypothetical protein